MDTSFSIPDAEHTPPVAANGRFPNAASQGRATLRWPADLTVGCMTFSVVHPGELLVSPDFKTITQMVFVFNRLFVSSLYFLRRT